MKPVSHEVILDSGRCPSCERPEPLINPGETRRVSVDPQCIFRGEEVVPIDGVDYEAFDIESILVGGTRQFDQSLLPATRLFGSPIPFTTCKVGIHITFVVINKSSEPKRFAVKIVGRAIL